MNGLDVDIADRTLYEYNILIPKTIYRLCEKRFYAGYDYTIYYIPSITPPHIVSFIKYDLHIKIEPISNIPKYDIEYLESLKILGNLSKDTIGEFPKITGDYCKVPNTRDVIYIDDLTFEYVVTHIDNPKIVYVDENCSEFLKDFVSYFAEAEIIYVNPSTFDLNQVDVLCTIAKSKLNRSCSNALLDDLSTILQYSGSGISEELSSYRRAKFRKHLLKNQFHVDTLCDITNYDAYKKVWYKKYDTIIVSCPISSAFIINKCRKDKSVTKTLYDRTDNWSARDLTSSILEHELYTAVDKITCSAEYLKDSLPAEMQSKAKVIKNGCTVYPFKNLNKFKTRTAVYIGRWLNKVDIGYLYNLAKNNLSWNFILLGINYPKYKINYRTMPSNITIQPRVDELIAHDFIERCSIGLCIFRDNEFNKGMLPLKIFNYANAHIPTAYLNCKEAAKFPKIAFDLSKHTLDDICDITISPSTYDKVCKDRDWSIVFKNVLDYIYSK